MTVENTIHALEHTKHTLLTKGWTRNAYYKQRRFCLLGALAVHTCGLVKDAGLEGEDTVVWVPDSDAVTYIDYCHAQGELEATLSYRGIAASVSDWQDAQASKKPVLELIDATIARLSVPLKDPDPWPDPREPLEPVDPRGPREPLPDLPDPYEPDDEPIPVPV